MRHLKAGLRLDVDPLAPVGESWEISTEPSFPTTLESGALLRDLIAADPVWWLGEEVASRYGGCPLLVKVIDASANLSVQVHPPEEHALLEDDQCGKTEAWIVLATEPGARIYLGFRDGIDAEEVGVCLREGGSLADLMNDVPVQVGEVFLLRPGLPHALGAGITVVEPQRVQPDRRSMTYRFWDWNRKYDVQGNVAEDGVPRPLHVREAMDVTDWRAPRGVALVEAVRRTLTPIGVDSGLNRWNLLDEPELWAERWVGSGVASLPEVGTLLGILCLDGQVELTRGVQSVRMVKGQAAVVPAGTTEVSAIAEAAQLCLCCVPPPFSTSMER